MNKEQKRALWLELYSVIATNESISSSNFIRLTDEAYDAVNERFKDDEPETQAKEFGFHGAESIVSERPAREYIDYLRGVAL